MKILFDCERMKYRHTGFYHYCMHLGRGLIKQSAKRREMLNFYVPLNEEGIFGDGENYLIQKSWQKFYNPFASDYDLWHCTYQGSMYYPTNRKQKRVLTIHDLNFIFDNKRSDSNVKKHLRLMQEKIHRSDYITCISNYTLNHVKEHLNIGEKPVEVIYNGCNVPDNILPSKPMFASIDTPFLFTIGTIIEEKNFHVLPSLLVGNDYVLIIAGITQEEAYKQKILNVAKKWNVENRVLMPGGITEGEKWWLMKNCTAFLFPSLAEGFGLPVIEAMHFGKPVILSSLTCLPEIGSDAAYYFDSSEPIHMQEVFNTSLQDFESNERTAYIKAHAAKFSWEKAATKYWNIYNKLIN